MADFRPRGSGAAKLVQQIRGPDILGGDRHVPRFEGSSPASATASSEGLIFIYVELGAGGRTAIYIARSRHARQGLNPTCSSRKTILLVFLSTFNFKLARSTQGPISGCPFTTAFRCPHYLGVQPLGVAIDSA
jgi:hypothetical protein